MAKPFVPARYVLEMFVAGEPVRDRFNNVRPNKGAWQRVEVSSWWVDKTEEKSGDSVLRTIDTLHIHVPTGKAPAAASKVRLPDGTEWEVRGNVEDFNHGWHGFDTGLVVVHAVKVEG